MDMESVSIERGSTYLIKIQGLLRENWGSWLNGMVVAFRQGDNSTLITVAVPDQAALRGILNKLWDLNLRIISVSQAKENDDE